MKMAGRFVLATCFTFLVACDVGVVRDGTTGDNVPSHHDPAGKVGHLPDAGTDVGMDPMPAVSGYGWVLHDPTQAAIDETIDAAARLGVSWIELGEEFVSRIDELGAQGPESFIKALQVNIAVNAAHARGMKVFIEGRELPGVERNRFAVACRLNDLPW